LGGARNAKNNLKKDKIKLAFETVGDRIQESKLRKLVKKQVKLGE
jgi:hypothetical protein